MADNQAIVYAGGIGLTTIAPTISVLPLKPRVANVGDLRASGGDAGTRKKSRRRSAS